MCATFGEYLLQIWKRQSLKQDFTFTGHCERLGKGEQLGIMYQQISSSHYKVAQLNGAFRTLLLLGSLIHVSRMG